MFLSFVFCSFATMAITGNITNQTLSKILLIVIAIIHISTVIFFIVLTFLPKKVVMNESYVKAYKNAVPIPITKNWFHQYFVYSSIESCELYTEKVPIRSRSVFASAFIFPPYALNWKGIVKIKEKDGRVTYLSLEKANEFIEDVNMRIDALAEKKQNS